MKTKIYGIIVALAVVMIIGCGQDVGPDSISTHQAATPSPDCNVQCHSPLSTISPDPLQTNGSGADGKHIIHVETKGIYCDKCHLSYENDAAHLNSQRDTGNPVVTGLVNFDLTNPGGFWTLTTTTCSSLDCHGGVILDWYGTGGWTLPACATCHDTDSGQRRQVFGAAGDFGANIAKVSHHVAGAVNPGDNQCLVCHDLSNHMAGVVRVLNADTSVGIAFIPANPSSLEPFCLSCHDADGATGTSIGATAVEPFNNGSVLGDPPYPYATRIADSWAKSYGHGLNGNHPPGSKLTCMGTGQSGTGCHGNNGSINAHGSSNRVLATRVFEYDISNYVEANFDLCFTCHSNYPGFTKEDTFGVLMGGILDGPYNFYLGPNGYSPPYYTVGVTTRFADHNDPLGNPLYDDFGIWWSPNTNLHWAHIGFPGSDLRATGVSSGIHCVNCHDVHGSTTPYGSVYDEIGYINLTDGTNILGKMADAAYGPVLGGYPTYCAFNCHSIQGVTRAWFEPIVE